MCDTPVDGRTPQKSLFMPLYTLGLGHLKIIVLIRVIIQATTSLPARSW
jgi:hypothetical protein